MGKIGCHKCGKEYGTNPECLCWDLRRTKVPKAPPNLKIREGEIPKRPFFVYENNRLKEAQMKEGTWLVGYWEKTCPKCKLQVETEGAAYCPNCGKWLGVIRPHVTTFTMAGLGGLAWCALFFGISTSADFMPWSWVMGLPGGIIGLGALLSIVPFGKSLIRLEEKRRKAREWNAEVERRRKEAEEDRAERERLERKPQIEIQLKGVENFKAKLIDMREQIKEAFNMPSVLVGATEDDEDEGNQVLHTILEKICMLRDRTEELMERAEALEGPPPTLDDSYTPPTSGGELPGRNGPALFVSFKHSVDNQEAFEDIKRNLDDIYRLKSSGLWETVRQIEKGDVGRMGLLNLPIFTNRVNMPALPGQKLVKIRVVDDGSGDTRFPQFSFEIEVQKIDDPSNPCGFDPRRCRLIFGDEDCGIDTSNLIKQYCDKTPQMCRLYKNEEHFTP